MVHHADRPVRAFAGAAGLCLLAACASTGPAPRLTGVSPRAPDSAERQLEILNRVSWGANTTGAKQMAATGAERYIEQQLHPAPAPALPPEVQAHIDALTISQRALLPLMRD